MKGRELGNSSLKIVYLGGKQAGMIGLLSLLSINCNVIGVVSYDDIVEMIAEKQNLDIFHSIEENGFKDLAEKSDILVSCHGREIIPAEIFTLPRLASINVHPCLYKYKGKDPIGRLLEDGESKASVGVHHITEELDSGEVILEKFVDVSDKNSVEGVYNKLYPYYSEAIIDAVRKIKET